MGSGIYRKIIMGIIGFLTVKLGMGSTCPSEEFVMKTAEYREYTLSSSPFCRIFETLKVGTEENIYLFGVANYQTFLRKLDSEFREIYCKSYTEKSLRNSYDIAPDENYAYFISGDTSIVTVVQIDASTGQLNSAKRGNTYNLNTHPRYSRLRVCSDSNTVMFTGTSPTNEGTLCKWDILDPKMICFSVDQLNHIPSLVISTSGTVHIVNLMQVPSSTIMQMKRVDFGTSSASMSSRNLTYSLSSSTFGEISETIIDEEDLLFYLVSHQYDMLLFPIDAKTGELVDSIWKDDAPNSCTIALDLYSGYSTYVYMLYLCTNIFLSSYDYSAKTFSKALQVTYSAIRVFHQDRELYLAGCNSDNCAYSVSPINNKLVLNKLVSTPQTHFIEGNEYPIGAASPVWNSTTSYDFIDVAISNAFEKTYEEISSNCVESDVSFNIFRESYTLQPGNSYNLSVTIPCSVSGTTSITYSTAQYLTYEVPEWVELISSEFRLEAQAPDVKTDTWYYFKIISNIDSISYNKGIEILVVACKVGHCSQCTIVNDEKTMGLLCDICDEGYSLSDDSTTCDLEEAQTVGPSTTTEESVPESVQSSKVTAQAVVGCSVGVGLVSSLLSTSSPQGMWASINQYQLLMLAPLASSFVHNDVIMYLEGFVFATLSLSFLNLNKVPGFNFLYDYLAFSENDDYMGSIGVEYKSATISLAPFMLTVLCLVLIHLCVVLPLRWCNKDKDDDSKMKKASIKLFKYFTLTIYIRMLLESFILISLSSLSEINNCDTDSNSRIVSLVLAFLICALAIVLVGGIVYLWRKITSDSLESEYFGELFEGLKETKAARLYFFVFTSRRFLSVFIVSVSMHLSFYPKIVLYLTIQIVQVCYTLFVRPFEQIKDNIIEGINEVYYAVFIGVLVYLKDESDWDGAVPDFVIYFLLSNTLLVTTVQFGFLIYEIAKYIKSKSATSTSIRVIPEETKVHASETSTVTDAHFRQGFTSSNRLNNFDHSKSERIAEVIRQELMKARRQAYSNNELSPDQLNHRSRMF